MGTEELNPSKLEEEVAKITDEETPSEPTTEKGPPEEQPSEEKKPSEEETPGTETPLKTEEKPKEEEAPTEDDTRFDKHPRWQKITKERDEALVTVKELTALKEVTGELTTEEVSRLSKAGQLLRKYPALAEKVQKVIDDHNYGNEETKTEIESVRRETEDLKIELALDRYDKSVDKLIAEHKVDKEIEPLLKEVLENRVINQKLGTQDIPKEFEKALKDVNRAYNKKLASYIVDKSGQQKVPASPKERGKVPIVKKEPEEVHDVIDALTEGLKGHRAEPVKE